MSFGLGVDVERSGGLEQLLARVTDMRPALREVADLLRDRERGVFASRNGGQWGARTLVDTGGLLRSLTTSGGGNVEQVGSDELLFGTDVPAKPSRSGRPDRAAVLRARGTDPLPALTLREQNEAQQVLTDHLLDGLR